MERSEWSSKYDQKFFVFRRGLPKTNKSCNFIIIAVKMTHINLQSQPSQLLLRDKLSQLSLHN